VALIEVLATARYGQITGTSHVNTGQPDDREDWPFLVDPTGAPLLTDTGKWNVRGVDEGANAVHSDGRLYFFFGDVATDQSGNPPENSDLVAWTDEPSVHTHGGHQAMGLVFQLPEAGSGVAGQDQWQFCLKCSSLFWNGDPNFKGVCPTGGAHDTFGLGLNFVLPFLPTDVQGQPQWRFCVQCAGLFWNGDPQSNGPCPAGQTHNPAGFEFVIPTAPAPTGGQPEWRFCVRCHGLFWDGEASKGLCLGSPGGGIHLRAVTADSHQTSLFDHFRAPDGSPLRYTGPLETPNGAFSFDRVMYVFAGIAQERWSHIARPENPAFGQYLFSKPNPADPGPWEIEFLVSPRLGWCALDSSRSSFGSHDVLGFLFVAPHDVAPSPSRMDGFRCCAKCEAVFHANGATGSGVCQRGGPHEADPRFPEVMSFERDAPEDEQNQSSWRVCSACQTLYFTGDGISGICPSGGQHAGGDPVLRIPHVSIREDRPDEPRQEHWRFCRKCFSLFWNGDDKFGGVCTLDGQRHERAGHDFLIRHHTPEGAGLQSGWRLCQHCGVLFTERSPGPHPCQAASTHEAIGWEFTLDVAGPETVTTQPHWRQCGKCTALFFDGFSDKGICPQDHEGHVATPEEFQLVHNPGVDGGNRGSLQFCLRCHGLVRTDQPVSFPWLAPVVVDNSTHRALPSSTGKGLVMIGFDWNNFRLAWMPLAEGSRPRLDSVQYFHRGKNKWSDKVDDDPGYELFTHPHPGQYTHVSALWLNDAVCWVVLFSSAWNETGTFGEPIVARFSPDLLTWSDDVPVFDPDTSGAYGVWMHQPGSPLMINPKVPPSQPPGKDEPGWAYGAFILQPYTRFDQDTRVLDLHYLMSTASPYQVQLMHTVLRLPDPVVG
jgi:hypothetical protein